MNQSILVPVDGSEHSKRALDFAISTAKAFGDSMILLNVQPDLHTRNTTRFFSNEQIQEYTNMLAQEAMKEAVEILEKSGIPFTSKIRTGAPAMEIIEEAKANSTRSIVMGSRGIGPVVGKILGSVSFGVLHASPCPVIIVP